jgi:hypothetical protein
MDGFTLTISDTMGTAYHGLRGKEQGGATMSRPTRPKDSGQMAHSRGSLKDVYITKYYK